MPVFIDLPVNVARGRPFTVAGWVAADTDHVTPSISIDGRAVPSVLHDRPDVRSTRELSRFAFTTGIMAQIAADDLDGAERVRIEICCGSECVSKIVPVDVTSDTTPPMQNAEPLRRETELKSIARSWVERHLRCPKCRFDESGFIGMAGGLRCTTCRSEFPQDALSINMLLPEIRALSDTTPTTNVSSNPYTPDALALIASTAAKGGWVLDCGAGSRPSRTPHVVNLEIVDYESTDVLAIGETLPFKTNSFDAVLSLAVLEHVRNPFLCAQEIMRVLKPGGELIADVPFLQPSHGYPHHYYNMTQQGLTNLFAGIGDVIDCRVPPHGHPIFAVQWMLGQYLLGLPTDVREQFASMTIGEAASLQPHRFLAEPAAAALSPQAQDIVACLNTIRVRKPGRPPD